MNPFDAFNPYKLNKIMNRLDEMIDNAMNGLSADSQFDETKMSALEHKLNRFLTMTKTKINLQTEEKNKIKSLISDISHQTKTPLANILLYTQLLKEHLFELEQEEPVAQQLVNEISTQSEKLNFLITSLVKLSRLETGIMVANKRSTRLDLLLQSVLESIRYKADAKAIDFRLNCGHDDSVLCDEKWTTEALFNLVDNAVKYSPDKSLIKVTVSPYELFTRIDIQDQGMGIAEEEFALIFQRFYRSPATVRTEGLGLGLYLAREIIEMQGGYIKLKSKLGEGACFSVFLQK